MCHRVLPATVGFEVTLVRFHRDAFLKEWAEVVDNEGEFMVERPIERTTTWRETVNWATVVLIVLVKAHPWASAWV